MTSTITLHGATGTQGRHIAARLRAAGYEVRPLDSRSVDLTDVDSVVRAYTGADAVVVQLPLVFDPTTHVHAETVLTALAKAGVARAVFNPGTALPPQPIGVPFVDARVVLAQALAGVTREGASVVAAAAPYLENLRQPWSVQRIRERGEVVYPVPGDVPVPWLALDDLGDAIAGELTGEPNGTATATVALVGPAAVTGDRLAAAIAAAAGRDARWLQVTPAQYRDLLTPVIGAAAAAGVAQSYEQASFPPPLPPAEFVRFAPTTVERWAAGQDWSA